MEINWTEIRETLFSYFLKVTENWEKADELAQQTILKVYEKRGYYEKRPTTSFVQWAIRVGRNLYFDEINKKAVEKKYINYLEMIPSGYVTDQIFVPEKINVRREIRKITNHAHREVLMLRAYGYKLEEISDLLGINLNTVKGRCLRAKECIKKQLTN